MIICFVMLVWGRCMIASSLDLGGVCRVTRSQINMELHIICIRKDSRVQRTALSGSMRV